MPDCRGKFANYLGGGSEFTTMTSGNKIRRIRNKLTLNLEGFEVTLYQHPDVVVGDMTRHIGKFLHTTDVIVKDVSQRKLNEAKVVLNDLASLLSFAGFSAVRCYGYEYPTGSGLGSRISTYGATNYCNSPIDVRDGDVVCDFVTKTWANYRKFKKQRKLPVIFEYLVQSQQPTKPMELKLLIVFIVLESLKDTFARQQSIPYVKGFYRKIPITPHSNPNKWDRYSFEELLDLMLQSGGMRRGLKRVIKLRNEIIHSGISRLPFRSQQKIYRVSHDIIREYLLRILGYRGIYQRFAELKQKIL